MNWCGAWMFFSRINGRLVLERSLLDERVSVLTQMKQDAVPGTRHSASYPLRNDAQRRDALYEDWKFLCLAAANMEYPGSS